MKNKLMHKSHHDLKQSSKDMVRFVIERDDGRKENLIRLLNLGSWLLETDKSIWPLREAAGDDLLRESYSRKAVIEIGDRRDILALKLSRGIIKRIDFHG